MRRKHRKPVVSPELDITAFMNLMIVLVPVLLLSMVFAHTSILELNFPYGESLDQAGADEEPLQIQVIIRENQISVADSQGGLIKALPLEEAGYDFEGLQEVVKQLKARLPEKRDIAILAEPQISYQTLVSAMDAVRSYKAVVVADLVDAELFPDISIGDAPPLSASAKNTPSAVNSAGGQP